MLLAILPVGIEVLEAEADGVHQHVTAGTGRAGQVKLEPLTVGQGLRIGDRRQICIHAGRGRRYNLAQEVLPDKFPAFGRRCVGGLAGERQKSCLAQDTGTFRIHREVNAPEFLRGRGQSVELREIVIHEAVSRGEQFHEIAVLPH